MPIKSIGIKALLLAFVWFGLSACMGFGSGSPGLVTYSSEIPIQNLNFTLQQALPVKQKMPAGKIKINSALIQPESAANTVDVDARFLFVSFEIPEGIEGKIRLSGTLRYDPQSRELYLKNLTPVGLEFYNPSLAEYVSADARKQIPTIIAGELSLIPLYKAKEGFKAKLIKTVTVKGGKVKIIYGL